jgi:hypothetical protein
MTTKPGRWLQLFAFAATVGASLPSGAATTQVFYCGQTFRGRGILIGNLDCTGFGGTGVTIERGGLNLNGFSITGAAQFGVHCLTTCLISGPGMISGNGLDGIRTEGWVALRGVTVSNNALDGVNARNSSSASRVTASDSTIVNNGFNGIESDSSVILRRSSVTGNGEHGIDVGAQYCDTTGRLLLFRSTVSGNATSCSVSPVCADLSACGRNNRAPRVRNSSTCGTSYIRGSAGESWNVCSQD